jgi:uncharacterized protein YndB with AHSA1/START domain
MFPISASAWIPAPVEDVFAFFDDPDSILEFFPGDPRIKVFGRSPDGRLSYELTCTGRKGKEFRMTGRQLIREPPSRIVTESVGPRFKGISERTLSPQGEGTRVTITARTRFHLGMFGPIVELLQREHIRLEVNAVLQAVALRFAERPAVGTLK